MKANIIGGGPAGLYFAILAKKQHPEDKITVFERNQPDDTFGFGVVFSDETLSFFREADAESYNEIINHFAYWDEIETRYDGHVIRSSGHGFCGMSRKCLLQILQNRAYGLGVTVPVATIPAGIIFNQTPMQLNDAALGAIGINLNVTLNEDGSGEVAEGSYYPDVNTIEDENGACVTIQQVLPVSDPFNYTSMGNMMAAVGMAHPGVNVLGLPGISPMAGQQLGGLELSDSETFEDFPMFPAHPTLCDPTGTDCFPFTVGDIDGSGTLEIYPDVNLLGIPEYVPGGAPLTGLTAGYWLKEGVNTDEITSVYPGNTDPDFHLEWHGVDGADSGLGWGDDADADEDGDGTWFDRVVGIPGITATFMNPACGFNLPIYGDVTATFEAMGLGSCVDGVGSAASGYLMDSALATWGNFMTGNAAQFNGCLAATGGDMAFCAGTYPQFLADDSDHDFNGVDGRLTMNFDIPCVGVIEAREVIAEFIEVGGGECGTGDVKAVGFVDGVVAGCFPQLYEALGDNPPDQVITL